MDGSSEPKKRGRKPKPFIASDGTHINGLRRRPSDGRWELADGRTFVEPDERKALARFNVMMGRRLPGDDEPVVTLVFSADDIKPINRLDGKPHREVVAEANEAALFAWFAEQLRERPKYVAELTGIEQLGYLVNLKPPKPVPTFAQLKKEWTTHYAKSAEQKQKVIAAWNVFTSTSGVRALEDITPETVIAFRDAIVRRGWSGKTQQNLYTRIRRLLSFARDRAIAVDELNKALEYLALLKTEGGTVSLDPKPIEPADYQALLAAANDDNRALLYLMLNGAFYLGEAIRLRWSDIKNGCIVTHRKKTGKCVRVAVLWPETLAALEKVKRRGEFIFYNYAGKPLGNKGAEPRFRELRDAANVPHVTASMMRDAAYTTAVESRVNPDLCNILVGHRSGLKDHYVKRSPQMVAPACDAIRAAYINISPPGAGSVAA